MKFAKSMLLCVTALGLFATGASASDCRSVKGRVTSELVAQFSDGTPCPSPLGLCTEGRFTGRLKGKFRFIAGSLTPFGLIDMTKTQPNVAATTGVINLDTRFCGGTLVLDDTSVFSLDLDGSVASLQTPNGAASSGGCNGASGRVRLEGVFMEGCVDCKYRGEICGVGPFGDGGDDGDDG